MRRRQSHPAARFDLFQPLLAVVLTAAAMATPAPGETGPQDNKRLVARFTEAVNDADWSALEQIVAADFVRHSDATAGPPVTSREQFIELQKSFMATMPDQHVTIEALVAEADRVAVLATYSGTMTGPMGELAPTGMKATVHFLSMFRIDSGKISELWVEWDNVAILTQLGLFPPPTAGGE